MTRTTAGARLGRVFGVPLWPCVGLLLGAALIAALTETRNPTILGLPGPLNAVCVAMAGLAFALALFARDPRLLLPWRSTATTVALAFLGCLLVEALAGVSWPNSGDEYSNIFLADTLGAFRFSVNTPPDELLFKSTYVYFHGGRAFSPYPPGWPAFLAPFRLMGIAWLANPLLTLLLGIALSGALTKAQVPHIVAQPIVALAMLTPYTLFLGASLFPQTLAATLTACIVWAQLSDEMDPRFSRKLLIGAVFGVLLLTRYEVFAIVAFVYAVDQLILRRGHALIDALPMVLGAAPFAACLLIYNNGVTGNPFQLPSTWITPLSSDMATEVPGSGLSRALVLNGYWMAAAGEFGGFPILVLAVIAFYVKLRHRRCRFYDFIFPAALIAYCFVPFSGGHQYGARYWFFAWPVSILTIATGMVSKDGMLQFGAVRAGLNRFVAASLIFAAGAGCVLLYTTHHYIAARRAALLEPSPPGPAIVLLPYRKIFLWPWQGAGIGAFTADFTRNDIAYAGRVLYGRADAPDALARACRVGGRDVFAWEEPGHLVRLACR